MGTQRDLRTEQASYSFDRGKEETLVQSHTAEFVGIGHNPLPCVELHRAPTAHRTGSDALALAHRLSRPAPASLSWDSAASHLSLHLYPGGSNSPLMMGPRLSSPGSPLAQMAELALKARQ